MNQILLERQAERKYCSFSFLSSIPEERKRELSDKLHAEETKIMFEQEVICHFGGYASFQLQSLQKLSLAEMRFVINEAANYLHEDDLMSGCFMYGVKSIEEEEALKLIVYAVYERNHRRGYLD